MSRLRITLVVLLLAVMFGSAADASQRVELTLSGSDLSETLALESRLIFYESDSLILNGTHLIRGADYSIEPGQIRFSLSLADLHDTDSLKVIYTTVPDWAALSFGRQIPSADNPIIALPKQPVATHTAPSDQPFGSRLKISGAKTVRFTAQSAANSDFGQSLDLKIDGELSPGLHIAGSVSDRGFDPVYGTANSRISELDKLKLRLYSDRIDARVGDISVGPSFLHPVRKELSGMAVDLKLRGIQVSAAAARPRGVFQTSQFNGSDGFQGPYQVTKNQSAGPIVPASEEVYLDGQLLERGGDKDYTVDYPAGRITFSARHPIDRRSRIEEDYEPLSSSYKKEMFAFGVGASAPDSVLLLNVAVVREGDDKDESIAFDLSESDRALLAASGDSVVMRSAIYSDTAGDYILDSTYLPDTVLTYVGSGSGTLGGSFSWVGEGDGDYRFLGDGRYEYVGDGLGEYLPVTILPRAERTDHYSVLVGSRTDLFGNINVDLRASRYDRNLWSELNDGNNSQYFMELTGQKKWAWHDRDGELTYQHRLRDGQFQARSRITSVDFNRSFYLPIQFLPTGNEQYSRATVKLPVLSFLTLGSGLGRIEYSDELESNRLELSAEAEIGSDTKLTTSIADTRSTGLSDSLGGAGEARTYKAGLSLRVLEKIQSLCEYERDERSNDFRDAPSGTRYNRLRGELRRESEAIRYEYFDEDSLTGQWSESVRRHRVSVSSDRRLGKLSYDALLTGQWIDGTEGTERGFLSRSNLRYKDIGRRLDFSFGLTLADERRNARGIRYLEVAPGMGNYLLEEGDYIPDPQGNYIKVEELLSDKARVSRAEKDFRISKDWRLARIRLTSNIEEELLGERGRDGWWLLPFYSDDRLSYQFYRRRYQADVQLFPVGGFHAVNLRLIQNLEKRRIVSSDRIHREFRAELDLKQPAGRLLLSEKGTLFNDKRDKYFTAGGTVEGFDLGFDLRHSFGGSEWNSGLGYRSARTTAGHDSRQFVLRAGLRLRLVRRGELRLSTELYSQRFKGDPALASYLLTDNKPGVRGAIWTLAGSYDLKKQTRINISVGGRHSDDRAARITARGELIAEF